jgi:hypothetical protein
LSWQQTAGPWRRTETDLAKKKRTYWLRCQVSTLNPSVFFFVVVVVVAAAAALVGVFLCFV